MIQLSSKKTKDLDIAIKKQILVLKNSHWTYGLDSQDKFFKNKIKNNDLHNLLFFKSTLIGYTCLRVRKYNDGSKNKFLYFDTLVIKEKYRSKGFSKILMNFNNLIIEASKNPSHLVCKNEMVGFYTKHFWKLSPEFLIEGTNSYDQCLSYNYKPFSDFKKKKIVNL